MDIFDRIKNGDFTTNVVILSRPAEPALLRKPAGKLTPDELDALPAVLAAYNAEKAAADQSRKDYSADHGRCWAEFADALHADFDMTGHPKAALLYSKAYEMGHSAGMSEVANYYYDLLDLVR